MQESHLNLNKKARLTLSVIYDFNPAQRTEKQVLHGYITGLLQEYCVTVLMVWETSGEVFCCGTPNKIQKGNRFKTQVLF